MTVDLPPGVDDVGEIDLANALNLSESEEEEETEDIIDDFSQQREEVNRCPLAALSDELTHTCTGSTRLETRAPVLLPVPNALPHVRLPNIDPFRAKRKCQCLHERGQTRLVFSRYKTSCARARGRGQGEATGTRRWRDWPP